MRTIRPRMMTADLWDADGRLGKTLDALFTHKSITGLLMGYYCVDGFVIATGPAQIATQTGSEVRLFEDLPEDDKLAAAIGRAIQAVFSAGHIVDYLDNIKDDCKVAEDGEPLQALFTANGMFLFQDDPCQVIETHPIEEDLATVEAQLCTIVMRPAPSAHAKISRSKAIRKECDVFYKIQKNGLDILKAQKIATLSFPSEAHIAEVL